MVKHEDFDESNTNQLYKQNCIPLMFPLRKYSRMMGMIIMWYIQISLCNPMRIIKLAYWIHVMVKIWLCPHSCECAWTPATPQVLVPQFGNPIWSTLRQVERLEAELEVYQMKNSSLTKQVQHGAARTHNMLWHLMMQFPFPNFESYSFPHTSFT